MKGKIYIRDGRSPLPKSEIASKTMSANKSRNTTPEILLRKELLNRGIRGYRLHYKNIPGRPDIVFTKIKLAIFVNGCFWHRCPNCNLPMPKNNRQFWSNKFEKNTQRDKAKINLLNKGGWNVIVVWECELRDDINKSMKGILRVISKNKESFYEKKISETNSN